MIPASRPGGVSCRNCQFQDTEHDHCFQISEEKCLLSGALFSLLSPLILLIEIASINPAPFDVFLPNLHGGLLQ